ncbi:MAG TPA: ATPase, T2SS/T4P/T4SS family [Acidimicrobiales bacterium]|nr:ATPase, T2SS/T4P/T4SS family [Acidimicrobiales bacterium]
MTEAWVSPLSEIEHAVQTRAKASALDLSADGGPEALRELIADEVTLWQRAYERGDKSVAIPDQALLADRVFRNLAGYGPLEPLLADPDVWEIMINSPDLIFVRRHRGLSGYHDEVFHDDEHVERTLTKILDDARGSHRKLDASEGLQDARLASGARVHIVHGDIARDGHLLVNIRKFTGLPVRTLDHLAFTGTLGKASAAFLKQCAAARTSILFAGAPGSGKTTLLSCCASELDPSLRIVVAEEVFEADIALPNVAHMQTRPKRSERAEVDLRRLVSGFLRMAPDVAIVGEVRDREALALLLTLSSGVKGFTTIHAGSTRQALTRLRFIAQLSEAGASLPFPALTSLVSDAVDLVVHTRRNADRYWVDEIAAVEDHHGDNSSAAFTVTDLFRRSSPDQELSWTGNVPVRLRDLFTASGVDVLDLLDPDRSAPYPGAVRS